jgi:hypothetical protein
MLLMFPLNLKNHLNPMYQKYLMSLKSDSIPKNPQNHLNLMFLKFH